MENAISSAMVELFDGAAVARVSMRFDPRRLSHVVRVDIQCPVRVFSLHSHEKEKLEIAVE